MSLADAERRMAAILAADVVGYGRLIEHDEARTLVRLRDLRREVFDPLVAAHHGRVFKLMGDGAVVEFASVVDAVACAAAVQQSTARSQTATQGAALAGRPATTIGRCRFGRRRKTNNR